MKETETASGLGGGGSPGLSYAILGFIPALALGQSEGKKKKKKRRYLFKCTFKAFKVIMHRFKSFS